MMSIYRKSGRYLLFAVVGIAALVSLGSAKPTTELNPAALKFQLPNQINWVEQASGASQAIVAGDITKPGMYVELVRWHAGHFSHPHFHPNDRFIMVLSGTWWVGTGTKFDPDNTVAMPAGTFVTHYAKQIHYDGAKNEDAVLEIVGEGPGTSTPAEVK
jgi:hypothetical protein